MTTLAVIGDIHAHHSHLDRVLARISEVGPDGILLVGDLSRGGRASDLSGYHQRLAAVFASVRSLGLPVLYVPGNHDLRGLEHPGNVDGDVATIGGLRVAGIGGAGPARFGFPYEWDEDEIRARSVPDCDLLLVHCPPARTPLDVVYLRGTHVGSEAIRERAEAHVGLLVCGHIHESPGAVVLNCCLCVNAGGLGKPFGRPQVAFVRRTPEADEAWHEDLDSGQVRRWSLTRSR